MPISWFGEVFGLGRSEMAKSPKTKPDAPEVTKAVEAELKKKS